MFYGIPSPPVVICMAELQGGIEPFGRCAVLALLTDKVTNKYIKTRPCSLKSS